MQFATERDVGNAVVFLLSDGAAMITGTALPVDGGFLASGGLKGENSPEKEVK